MPKLVVCRGLPASGKSTFAFDWVNEDLSTRARVNRDTIREMLHFSQFVEGITEKAVIAARDHTIRGLLRSGYDVINDDTNLRSRNIRDLQRTAAFVGAEIDVVDFCSVPVEECIRRDRSRENGVGEEVINNLYLRYLKGKTLPLPIPDLNTSEIEMIPYSKPQPTERKYGQVVGPMRAVVVDIDGTLALMNGRGPYDEDRVGEDLPNKPVIDVVNKLAEQYFVIVVSGRHDSCKAITAKWLRENDITFDELLMRKTGDDRADWIIKYEIFDEHIRKFDVVGVFDDRQRVVEMWRQLGLTVFQVAEGNF